MARPGTAPPAEGVRGPARVRRRARGAGAALAGAALAGAALLVLGLPAGGGTASAATPTCDGVPPTAAVPYIVLPAPSDPAAGEGLFQLSERVLRDGNRYMEIFWLNVNKPQPVVPNSSGTRCLADPEVLLPGWVLQLPPDADKSAVGVQVGTLPTLDMPNATGAAGAQPGAAGTPTAPGTPSPEPTKAPSTAKSGGDPFADPAQLLKPKYRAYHWGLVGLVVLILMLAARHHIATALRWIARHVARGVRALIAAVRAFRAEMLLPPPVRRRRAAAVLTARLESAAATGVVPRAAAAVALQIAAPDEHGAAGLGTVYGAELGADAVTLLLAGTDLPQAAPPWTADGTGLRWTAAVTDLDDIPEPPSAYPLFVAVGVTEGRAVLLDLARAPGVVVVDGEREPALMLARALGTQIAHRADAEVGAGEPSEDKASGRTVVFTAAASPGGNGGTLAEVIDDLPVDPPEFSVVVAADATTEDLQRLAESGVHAKLLATGTAVGACWVLHVGERAKVHMTAPRLTASTLGLHEAVAKLVEPLVPVADAPDEANAASTTAPAEDADATVGPAETAEKSAKNADEPAESAAEPAEAPNDLAGNEDEPSENADEPAETAEESVISAEEPAETADEPVESVEPSTPVEAVEAVVPTESVEPTEPVDPAESGEPAEAVEPAETAAPTEAAEPAESAEPEEIAEPVESAAPTDPAETTASAPGSPDADDSAESSPDPAPQEPEESATPGPDAEDQNQDQGEVPSNVIPWRRRRKRTPYPPPTGPRFDYPPPPGQHADPVPSTVAADGESAAASPARAAPAD
ncbi:hypothetical protein OG216_39670 [Streptomycetaceae bacterium NBC_01309]